MPLKPTITGLPFLLGLLTLLPAPVGAAPAAEGDVERRIQEEFRLGEADWKRSCAKPSDDGACVRVAPAAAGRARCGPATASDLTVVARDKRRAASAKQHLEAAARLWREGPQQKYGAPTATAAAGALFYLAEGQYEDLLRKTPPTDLDFSRPGTDSAKRFSGYLEDKSKAINTTRDAYLEVFKIRHVPWGVAAAARVGQSYQSFSQQVQTMPIPKDLAGKADQREIYCKALEEKAVPIAGKAIEAFEACIKTANENDGRGNWSELCERELGRLKPSKSAPAAEPGPAAPAPTK